MNMHSPLHPADTLLTRTEIAGLVALAARTVPPMWPLESAIAVNPLAGFEDRPFEEAVRHAAALFGARESLPLSLWRRIYQGGRIERRALRDAAIRHLGGTYAAMASIAPGVMAIDALMARLLDTGPSVPETSGKGLDPAAAFIAKWCGAFFDEAISASPMPNRELGLYRAVLSLLRHDAEYAGLTGERGQTLLLTVPRDPYEAIAEALAQDGGVDDPLDRLSALVARLLGWAGHIRWRTEHADRERVALAPAGMADLLALWLLLDRAGAVTAGPITSQVFDAREDLARHFGLDRNGLDPAKAARLAAIARLDDGSLGALFLSAAEWTYANALVPKLLQSAMIREPETRPAAQLVFCIDVRSEPLRRQIESTGPNETFGYAGFFGLPIALRAAGAGHRKRLLPVLLSPQHDVAEGIVDGQGEVARETVANDDRNAAATGLFGAAKLGTGSAFATAEATGLLAGLAMAARTLAPRLADRARARREQQRRQAFEPKITPHAGCAGFSLADKIGYASAMFRLTGMKPETARLVVLCGHGGSAVNNPYAAALDCGACGGHAGGSNARILAAMLNEPDVRQGMAAQGLAIADDTWFLAAEHDTTTDEVTIFDPFRVPETHRAELASLQGDLAKAGARNRARRAALLGRTPDDLLTGAAHWGEIRPEWGLAGNAAFLVGPRGWSRGIDLEGRAFLHSYDWQADPAGEALTTILTAPMVVAQWINCQYLFSTIDNDRYGSGDKVTHNVCGGIGVVQGNGGDLKVGLPRQSLFDDAGDPHHVPQRLLTVVLAPIERVEAVVASNDILGRLFGNGWVQLVVVDPRDGRAMRWRTSGCDLREGQAIRSLTC
ncbi:DUF2309 domain-containing protein [Croceicoccus sp. BE223]|uniref:DUF2309 domain-containing protein n=1 Tax=Croceicoccus sp. BE223 TaxID=2817716 RepID=UPI002865A1EF|nr:DUF2309 domain-containing protein [Croceicoccus sp. BE223]MDR7103629.1 uncharacterized protein YbcC (UPF0753/DUF2309 family) [Croceicoccus sp. BE223]